MPYWSLKFENLNRRVELLLSVEVSRGVQGMQGMYVYYWRTWYKAVGGGKGGSEGHVLRDTTSRGLRGRV